MPTPPLDSVRVMGERRQCGIRTHGTLAGTPVHRRFHPLGQLPTLSDDTIHDEAPGRQTVDYGTSGLRRKP